MPPSVLLVHGEADLNLHPTTSRRIFGAMSGGAAGRGGSSRKGERVASRALLLVQGASHHLETATDALTSVIVEWALSLAAAAADKEAPRGHTGRTGSPIVAAKTESGANDVVDDDDDDDILAVIAKSVERQAAVELRMTASGKLIK